MGARLLALLRWSLLGHNASYTLIREIETKETARRLYDGPVFDLSFWTGDLCL